MTASASLSGPKGFDYATLDAETTQFVQQQTGEIRVLMKRTAQDILKIGQKLIEVKKRLGHGCFLDWLQAEFGWSYPTAARFMQVVKSFGADSQIEKFALSALYILSASSIPETARVEALARAEAGEAITYKAAKAIKQKHASPQLLPNPELVSQPQPPPTPAPQPPVYEPEQPGIWWQLGGRHLLYCGEPNSPAFTGMVTEEVQLLLAFPPTPDWQSAIRAKTRIITVEYLPQGRNLVQLDENLESNVLFHSTLGDLVVSCFLPSPEILSVVNRLERRGLFAEPDSRRFNAVICDWKRAGLLAEQVSF